MVEIEANAGLRVQLVLQDGRRRPIPGKYLPAPDFTHAGAPMNRPDPALTLTSDTARARRTSEAQRRCAHDGRHHRHVAISMVSSTSVMGPHRRPDDRQQQNGPCAPSPSQMPLTPPSWSPGSPA
jgi:hypothetical protein